MTWVDATAWMERAACANSDIDVFFPSQGDDTRTAKAICDGCPVRTDCLDYAIAHNLTHGVWGGLSERQRRKIRRPIGPRPCRWCRAVFTGADNRASLCSVECRNASRAHTQKLNRNRGAA